MWSRICKMFKCLEMKVFKAPTLQEIAEQKRKAAWEELHSAEHALKVAQYRRHMASSEIQALMRWDLVKEGMPILGDTTDAQPIGGNHVAG